jgi:hypothetical protein
MAKRNQANTYVDWQQVFKEVMEHYVDAKSSTGSMKSLNYENALEGSVSGANTKVVKPSLSDFVCDVELAVRRVLSYNELVALFEHVYDGTPETPEIERLQQKVGRIFDERNIHPVGVYFKAKDVR